MEEKISLTEAEWSVMECLWELKECTGREITDYLEKNQGWNRSTTLTLLRRLEGKMAVSSGSEQGKKVFKAVLSREEAALSETKDFISRVYHGSLGMLVSSFTKKENLSKEEIQELKALLLQLEEN